MALKGLQLAANDAMRGVLGADKIELIKNSVRSLVNDLADHEDRDPHPDDKAAAAAEASRAERALPAPPAPKHNAPEASELAPAWQGPVPVLCLAGRGPLDEAASAMLAQLLGKHGLGARVASHEAASRENVRTLDATGIAMVCISYLEISGSPSNLHFLLRRLRQRLPGIPILVGLWPSDDEALHDKRVRAVIAADHYTTSLKDAVETCVKVAHEKAGTVPGEDRDVSPRPAGALSGGAVPALA